jgi:acyl-CoA synthetase (AMP-forming)/AMP-acid ligase II/carbonic anhydrase/acetyltransferase-like protein (isoleucine patch superfamily)
MGTNRSPSKRSHDLPQQKIKLSPIVSSCEHLLQPNGAIIGRDVARAILPLFPSMCSAIPADSSRSQEPALASIDGRRPISQTRIRDFILNDFGPSLHRLGFGKGHRIALVLPNGPELALAILAIANWASCVPLNANGAKSELEADLQRCGADVVIGPYAGVIDLVSRGSFDTSKRFQVLPGDGRDAVIDFMAYDHVEETAKKLGIPFVGLLPSPHESGIFRLIESAPASVSSRPISPLKLFVEADISAGLADIEPEETRITRFLANSHEDEILVLFTSGTTGNKKLVPHHLGDILVATAIISLSWNLTPLDINCNLMPLFHVGGIVRQVFSPVLSGGCVICCPSFDPSIFWSLMQKKSFTWYYAAPTMHQIILQTGRQPLDDSSGVTHELQTSHKLRMIANAAGGLLPSLARELQKTFHANVLPSYGMTECMPISSPPHTYQLEKPGTSGVAVGPEICILNLSTSKPLPTGKEGPICVRGEPCFRGYGKNHADPCQTHENAFLEGGWFNTGDLGYMDSDGYLYITGRSKEVINRGGEIISPLEVEEAVASHPDVVSCAAFSALHHVLQEVVGIVVVPAPGRPRICLQTLHDHLGETLVAAKWPQCLVFMDALPKSHTNKLLRVKLGQRLGLPELHDGMYPIERTFQAKCPVQGLAIQSAIPSERVPVCSDEVEKALASELVTDLMCDQQLLVVPHPTRIGFLVCYVCSIDRVAAIEVAQKTLDRYCVPSHFVELEKPVLSKQFLLPPQPTDAVSSILQNLNAKDGPVDPLVTEMQQLFQNLLDLDCLPAPDTNFFNLGGSSMMASQLASRIRKKHEIPFSGAEVFHFANCNAMATMIRQRGEEVHTGGSGFSGSIPSAGDRSESMGTPGSTGFSSSGSASSFHRKHVDHHGAPFTASRIQPKGGIIACIVQLIPICIVFPIWQMTRFFLFFSCLLASLKYVPAERNLFGFVVTLVFFHLGWVSISPLVFVLIKWTVIGRYQQGRYPLWGSYYLRWWFVDVCRKLFGRGIWGSNEPLLNIYYRLLGAKIGTGARISLEADIAEWDLVTIGNNAAIEYATVRAFGVDNGAMILGPVGVGEDSSVGARSVVVPYTSVPDGAHLGPVTSSYEVGSSLDAKHARVNRRWLTQPNFFYQIFVAGPIEFLVVSISHIPPLIVLYFMVQMKWQQGELFETMSDLMEWLCDVRRIPFYIGIRVTRALVSPLVYMATAILVKWCIIGKFQPGVRDTASQWQLTRHSLSATLFSRQNMQDVTEIIGRHYELVSHLYRLLGARVGKRVFWPGHQPVFSGEFELLEIGDDVVFGSRSSIFCTTVDSCEKVILCAGANVSDNCVVLPGSIIGKNAVLGSNSVCPEGWYLPESSIWLGSKGCEPVCLEKGVNGDLDTPMRSTDVKRETLQLEGDESTLRPFGKAFYFRKAPYFVLPLSFIILFTVICKFLIAVFHTLPLLGALHGAAAVLYGFPVAERVYDDMPYSTLRVYIVLLCVFFITHSLRCAIWLMIDLTAKWSLMGQRQEGRYNYDTSSYAQRWELYQIICKVRKFGRLNMLDFIAGTPYMSQYFRWNGCQIGHNSCLFPAGGDPYMPEPDLMRIGERCVIDCASVVCHLNTRGNFELAKIVMENHCTLRTRSRIQQGVYMEAGSMLLEKSLAMTGEVIESDTVWQGAPASAWFKYSPAEILQPSVSFTSHQGGHSEDSMLV